MWRFIDQLRFWFLTPLNLSRFQYDDVYFDFFLFVYLVLFSLYQKKTSIFWISLSSWICRAAIFTVYSGQADSGTQNSSVLDNRKQKQWSFAVVFLSLSHLSQRPPSRPPREEGRTKEEAGDLGFEFGIWALRVGLSEPVLV